VNRRVAVIKNVRIPDLEAKIFRTGDLLVTKGARGEVKVEELKKGVASNGAAEVIDGANMVALPLFLDLHCHLRDPGFTKKEDIASGTAAAAAGGYGAIVSIPNTNPVTDNAETVKYILKTAEKEASCRVYPSAAVTVGQAGKELVDFDALHEAGAVAFSDDGRPVSDSSVMKAAMEKCAERGYLILSHSEEKSLSEGGAINEGRISKLLGVKGIPASAESIGVARDIILAAETGCRLHLMHISTRQSVELIRAAKALGVNITAETCPHYFSLKDEDVVYYGTNAKMSPPLRSEDDVKAIIEGIVDGTIDCIATDHAPHTEEEKKKPLSEAPNGITGIQTAFAAGMTYLVQPGHIDIFRLVELMSTSPAKILGVDVPSGVVLASPTKEFIVTKSMLKSKSFNTPFLGMTMTGIVERTYNGF